MQEEISFGVWLRKQRRALDLSRQVFANRVGCAEVTLRRIEAGTLKPSKELANILLEKIGIPEIERNRWISFARGLSSFPLSSTPFSNKPITNLPALITTFIGREKEQSEVTRLIEKHRLVTLTGSGGVGKTRLSIKVGEQILSHYPDGVWLAEFAHILDPVLVPRTTAIAIGLRDEPQRPVMDMLSDYLHEKSMLIILDNCEHLLDECAQLADTLLKRCPTLKILATSREALDILGEAVYHVPSLELPDIQHLLDRFRAYESVHLFEERAQLVQMNFSLTIENAPFVAKICTHLDGIPLAIELAAARVSTFSTEQIEKRLHEGLSLLTRGNRTALPRHQTLQAAIDWSYELLSPAEQTLFQRLSVFINGWTVEAAMYTCSDANIQSDAVLGLLTELVNKSLVMMGETQGQMRYRMLETLRQYSDDKLIESGEKETLRDRHLAFFLNLAEIAEPYLIRIEQIEWLPILDADYENLRTALEWALSKDSPEVSLRLCGALGPFWLIHSYYLEGLKWLGIALSKPSQNPSEAEKVARIRALNQDARLADTVDQIERMKTSAELSLTLANQGTDKRDTSIARFYLGLALNRRKEDEAAVLLMKQSLAEFHELNDSYWEAYSFRQLGYWLEKQDKLKRGEWYLQGVELARKAGERLNLADALWDYFSFFYPYGRSDEALKYVEEADMLYKQINSMFNWTPWAFGTLAWLNGDYRNAKSHFGELQEHYALMGEKNQRSVLTAALGRIALEESELGQAQSYFDEALSVARELEQRDSVAVRLAELSNVFYLQRDLERYRQCLNEGVHVLRELGRNSKVYFLNAVLISIHMQEPEGAAKILGAIYATEKASEAPILGPLEKRYCNRAEEHARKSLGKIAFGVAFADGQKMSLNEALDLVLKSADKL